MVQIKVLAVLLIVAILTEVQAGLIESRLWGSKDSEKQTHIYHVAITRELKLFCNEEFLGSGALVSPAWVLTSARIASKVKSSWTSWMYHFKVKAGLETLRSEPVQTAYIETVVIHEFYRQETDNDIALIKVEHNGFVIDDVHIGVVALASEGYAQVEQVVVTGWLAAGKENKPLQEVSLDIKKPQSCAAAFEIPDLIDETLFCVENTDNHAVCANDYGSPAIIVNGDEKVLLGIFTFTREPLPTELCGKYPGVFSNVTYYLPWITAYVTP